jgi:hypothetical protein
VTPAAAAAWWLCVLVCLCKVVCTKEQRLPAGRRRRDFMFIPSRYWAMAVVG